MAGLAARSRAKAKAAAQYRDELAVGDPALQRIPSATMQHMVEEACAQTAGLPSALQPVKQFELPKQMAKDRFGSQSPQPCG